VSSLGETGISIDEICPDVVDRDTVQQILNRLEKEDRIMISDGLVFVI
jgi:hypothetical protein